MRQLLRARWPRELATAAVIETVTMETETAQLAAIPSTRHESKERGWLKRVSIRVRIEERRTATYLCCPCHPSTAWNVHTDSLNVEGDAEESKSKLQKSA